ncbi:hypothetical protein GCM10020254_23500 [Streptomyces goshikiensis]
MPLVRPAVAATALAFALTLTLAPPAPASAPATAVAAENAGAERVARRAAAGHRALDFRSCPAAEGLAAPVRCAALRVPLDYARPDGPQISLTVSRVGATREGRAARQGSLVFNPGGPGASGMYFPLLADRPAWRRVAAAYDLVGYAPRGVGRSAPLSCQDPAARPKAPHPGPGGPLGRVQEERVAAARAYARGCARRAARPSRTTRPSTTPGTCTCCAPRSASGS